MVSPTRRESDHEVGSARRTARISCMVPAARCTPGQCPGGVRVCPCVTGLGAGMPGHVRAWYSAFVRAAPGRGGGSAAYGACVRAAARAGWWGRWNGLQPGPPMTQKKRGGRSLPCASSNGVFWGLPKTCGSHPPASGVFCSSLFVQRETKTSTSRGTSLCDSISYALAYHNPCMFWMA